MASANGSSKLHNVFVYGTLKKGEPNHDCITNSKGFHKYVSQARTCQRWPLVIASMFNVPFLLHEEGAGHRVIGEVYAVDDEKLAILDQVENHPILYERMEYDVKLLKDEQYMGLKPEIVKCWIYFLKKYKDKLLKLPMLDEYTSYGTHGLEYNPRESLMYPEDIYTIRCIL